MREEKADSFFHEFDSALYLSKKPITVAAEP